MRLLLTFILAWVCVESSPSNYTFAMINTRDVPTSPTSLGRQAFLGYRLAVEDLNNNSEILPNTYLYFESKSHQRISALAVEAMINYSFNNQTLVIGNPLSEVCVDSGIVGAVYGIAQLSSTATSTDLSDEAVYPYFSRLAPPTSVQSFVLNDIILYYGSGRAGWTDVAIMASSEEYGINTAMNFIHNADAKITISTFQQYILGQENFDVELNEVKKSGARVILALILNGWDDLIHSANDKGLVGEQYVWFVSHVVAGNSLTSNSSTAELTNGAVGSFQYIPNSGPKYESYVNRWHSLDPEVYYGAGPDTNPGPFSLLAYDVVFAAALAVQELDNRGELEQDRISPEVWNEAIRSIQFEGLSGNVTFLANGDRESAFRVSYFSIESHQWETAGIWSSTNGYTAESDIVWYSNSTDIPDLDIRPPFYYWSCYDGEIGYDETGKTISLHTPDGSDINEISSHYHCDQFIDCQNFSDERIDCDQNFLVVFIVFGIVTGLLLSVSCVVFIFVIIYGIILRYRRLRTASPTFLVLMILSTIVGYCSVFAWFGKPHPVACAFQPWLLGIPIISIIASLCVKNFRIWRIFSNRMVKQNISDLYLLGLWFLLVVPSIVIVAIWTIISTPTAAMIEREGEDHYICTTGGITGEPGGIVFFVLLVAYGAFVLAIGMFFTIVTRNVPSQFNETKLLAISIYNLAFLSVVIIPVFIVLQFYNPFAAWIIRTCAILYAFTATLLLQFSPPILGIFIIDKGRNVKKFKSSLKFSTSGTVASRDIKSQSSSRDSQSRSNL